MGVDLAAFRTSVGVTQQEIATETGLSQATISRIEHKASAPTGQALLLIQDWADEVARDRRIPVARRLGWDWLRDRRAA